MSTKSPPTLQEQLSQLFGSYKAEWLKEHIFELFTEPAYFPELLTTRSCVLIGGRGTGKTTVLRGLSYQGQLALASNDTDRIHDWQSYGLYYRVDTNHVTAFSGPELRIDQWTPLFAHYFNILLCEMVLDFVQWYELNTRTTVVVPPETCNRIAVSLHLHACDEHRAIRDALLDAKVAFEAYINNVVDAQRPPLSLQSAPINLLCSALLSVDAFRGKQFFFLLDEYENFLDHQQQVVNTLIKHAGALYSFKIGVRELGWRCRSTLNENEQLIHPADYARISISEKLQGDAFEQFAVRVCETRLARLQSPDAEIIRDPRVALPGLTEDEEADALGVQVAAQRVRENLLSRCTDEAADAVQRMSGLELYFVEVWAQAQEKGMQEVLNEALGDYPTWETRFGNYKHALLYTIRRGKRGIRKYYAGWGTFVQLAAGNIRYVLELVDQSLLAQYKAAGSLATPIAPDIQTKVAQQVGGMNLSELEGLAVNGAQLTKLLLALGRIFQVMAADAVGHAPEVNQFELGEAPNGEEQPSLADAERLLSSAVMHLALLRVPGNKLADVGDTKDYDYMVHPVFSALFEFSPRRKRKMKLMAQDIVDLVRRPKQTIRRVLAAQNRIDAGDIPEQLTLFERFYHADA
jgi:hypothetical protein